MEVARLPWTHAYGPCPELPYQCVGRDTNTALHYTVQAVSVSGEAENREHITGQTYVAYSITVRRVHG